MGRAQIRMIPATPIMDRLMPSSSRAMGHWAGFLRGWGERWGEREEVSFLCSDVITVNLHCYGSSVDTHKHFRAGELKIPLITKEHVMHTDFSWKLQDCVTVFASGLFNSRQSTVYIYFNPVKLLLITEISAHSIIHSSDFWEEIIYKWTSLFFRQSRRLFLYWRQSIVPIGFPVQLGSHLIKNTVHFSASVWSGILWCLSKL